MNHKNLQINKNKKKNLRRICYKYDDKQCDNKHKTNSSHQKKTENVYSKLKIIKMS